jgi:hypothetical protein
MATEYRLTLAGSTPLVEVAERALPEPDERPVGTPQLLSADLHDRYGFEVILRAGRNGYLDAESDSGLWVWEPDEYVSVRFRMEKNADSDRATVNMLLAVRRILLTGPEDAALVLDGNYLLLNRVGGVLVKHRRETWWQSYAAANDLFRD